MFPTPGSSTRWRRPSTWGRERSATRGPGAPSGPATPQLVSQHQCLSGCFTLLSYSHSGGAAMFARTTGVRTTGGSKMRPKNSRGQFETIDQILQADILNQLMKIRALFVSTSFGLNRRCKKTDPWIRKFNFIEQDDASMCKAARKLPLPVISPNSHSIYVLSDYRTSKLYWVLYVQTFPRSRWVKAESS